MSALVFLADSNRGETRERKQAVSKKLSLCVSWTSRHESKVLGAMSTLRGSAWRPAFARLRPPEYSIPIREVGGLGRPHQIELFDLVGFRLQQQI